MVTVPATPGGPPPATTTKMDIPRPVYNWLLTVRTDLAIAKERDVKWAEVLEHVKDVYQGKEAGR